MLKTRFTLFVLAWLLPVLGLVGLGTAVYTPTAHAAPLATVTTLADSGAGSLRQAIAEVDPGGTINFSVSGTIVLASELVIDKDLTINGGGEITISGNNTTRVFNVMTSTLATHVNVTFDSLTIISGTVQTTDCGTFALICGGGIMIQNSGVAVTVTHSTLSGNSAPNYGGGGIFNYKGRLTVTHSTLSGNSATIGGGIYNNDGTLTVTNSTLSGNSANKGGGIFTSRGTVMVNNSTLSSNSAATDSGGGIFNNEGTLTVTHSTLSGNSAISGGGIYNNVGPLTINHSTLSGNLATNNGGGIFNNSGTLMVNHSTLSGNSAINNGGGIQNASPVGTCADLPRTIIHNSTLSGNSATNNGGGMYNFRGVAEVSHSTITGNTAAIGGGGGIGSFNNDATCTRVGGTIIAGNSTSHDVMAVFTTQRFVSLGHNLIGTAGANVDFTQEFTATGDMTNTLPLLGSLADNGGSTLTHALLPDSPAIDGGNCTSGPATDQRGVARPQDETCDIGAVEMVLASFELIYLPLVVR
jgi:hypothetical protein